MCSLRGFIMIRVAEAVFDGHPDKFCDIIADSLIAEGYEIDPDCYGQVEVGVWSDAVWLSGVIVTRNPLQRTGREIVTEVGERIGYKGNNHINARLYRVVDEVCYLTEDPNRYTKRIHDQTITIGWAGYDPKTLFLPPEQFMVHSFRRSLIDSFRNGLLKAQGPDGKFLICMREEGEQFILEEVLLTLQHKESISIPELSAAVDETLGGAYEILQNNDARWTSEWQNIRVTVNPNGPLIWAGSDGDNGQTGRKLVMDYYGPRVPIGGGALSGKDLAHIDRIAAYKARHAAVTAVSSGASECRVTLLYSPARDIPIDVIYDMKGKGVTLTRKDFDYNLIKEEFIKDVDVGALGNGSHFYDSSLRWNQD
jgi:S-adenosylmethionine synthetase